MSKDNYSSIFSCQMETIVFIIHQIFLATRAVLKIGGFNDIPPEWASIARLVVVQYREYGT